MTAGGTRDWRLAARRSRVQLRMALGCASRLNAGNTLQPVAMWLQRGPAGRQFREKTGFVPGQHNDRVAGGSFADESNLEGVRRPGSAEESAAGRLHFDDPIES